MNGVVIEGGVYGNICKSESESNSRRIDRLFGGHIPEIVATRKH